MLRVLMQGSFMCEDGGTGHAYPERPSGLIGKASDELLAGSEPILNLRIRRCTPWVRSPT
jgi:hypothetical protein